MRYAIIYGSVREGRRGIKLVRFLERKLKERGNEADIIDPLVYRFPLLEKMYKNYENPPSFMKEVAGILEVADGFIIVSGEYNHSIPPALKNLLDHYEAEYRQRPSALVTYSKGMFGGVRNIANLRAIMGELGTVSIPRIFSVPSIDSNFDEKGNALTDSFDERAEKFLDELDWYADALAKKRN